MAALALATPIVPVASAYIDPGKGAVHDHGSAEILLNAVVLAGTTGFGQPLGLTTRGIMPMPHRYTWQTIIGGTGSFTSITVNLEGSLDGVNWFQLDQSTNATGETRHIVNKPIRYVRPNVVANVVASGAPTLTVQFGE
jgi:hypothetical protein